MDGVIISSNIKCKFDNDDFKVYKDNFRIPK